MRDERGRFVPGNPGGPGRPRRETELTYATATQEGCPPDKWLAIVKRATDDALNGDGGARSFLARYLLPPAGADLRVDLGYPEPQLTAQDLAAVRAELDAWDRDHPRVDLDRYLYASSAGDHP